MEPKKDGCRGDKKLIVSTTIMQVLKMKGQSVDVGSVEPKDVPMHQQKPFMGLSYLLSLP